jgi:hypothetical protein
MRKISAYLLPFLSILLFFLTAEVGLRLYHFLRFDISMITGKSRKPEKPSDFSPITLDSALGWRATENYRFSGIKHNADGTEYFATVSQDNRGFRMFGDLSSHKPRILVIGDSFTQAVDASDDKTYYASMKSLLNAEVFAYGVGGYGSYQEWMILDKYMDLIHPNLIVWQYAANDIVNNSPKMERASSINNNGLVRPYLIDGEVRFILPTRDSEGLRRFALRYCRIGYMILNRIDRLRAATQQTVETETAAGKPAHSMFLKALRTTDDIMGRVRARAGSIPIVAFMVGDSSRIEYFEGLSEISCRHGIILCKQAREAVLTAEKKGIVVRAADQSHWNEAGHEIAGQALAKCLVKVLPELASCPHNEP